MTRQVRPVAIVSTSIPPAPTGQANVIGRLVAGPTEAPVILLSDMLDQAPVACVDGARVVRLPAPAWDKPRTLLERNCRRCAEFAVFRETVRQRAEAMAECLAPVRPSVIVGCSGSPFDLPATFAAARRLRTDFAAYLFDDPVAQWPGRQVRLMLRFHEWNWARHAKRILVPNEALGAALQSRCGRPFSIVRNIVDDAAFPGADPTVGVADVALHRIVYTGSVYDAQADAFHTLVKALDALAGRFELHVYTAQSAETLAGLGIEGRFVFRHDYLPWPAIGAVQREAGALFLPLAFDPDLRPVLRTASPGKMGEYLASSRPILVHAPDDSFVSRFFRRHDCGTVVDKRDPMAMIEALGELSAPGVDHRIAQARSLAAEFGGAAGRRQFWQAVLG
ncbi:MAG TPA: hypothetical protein VFO41_00165 [Alphaproteobacteria bacterium]|nr:hypothetical protein [Alphaproteobacteria bacterium]